MNRLTQHVRSNAVAYLALFVALGGTGYAAINLPANSVGGKQIRNGSIKPAKLSRSFFGGEVRAWALVNAKGRVLAGEGRPSAVRGSGPGSVGRYFVTWHTAPMVRCTAIGQVESPDDIALAPGFVLALGPERKPDATTVIAQVYDAQGASAALSFTVEVLC